MPSPTRERFLRRRRELEIQRELRKKLFACRGTIPSRGEDKPCEWGLLPRHTEIDSIITCHRCGTIHKMTGRGWRTLEEIDRMENLGLWDK